jgi:hemerythrin
MESFHWDTHFETGIAMVDEQHHGLVDRINTFGQLLTQAGGASPQEIERLFFDLAAYAQFHFREEEQMMQALSLDSRHIAQHQLLHADFLREVTLLHARVDSRQETARGLLKFLIYWLAFHILGTDQSMARQVAALRQGQTADSAYLAEHAVKDAATEPLVAALQGLFQQVTERNRELQELNLTLEAKVQERTRALSEANHQLEQLALTDALTGLPNRRHAMARLAMAWADATERAVPLSCAMIDADGFKGINDSYGHDCGDDVLRQLARSLGYGVRTDDLVCRLGGDEFFIIFSGAALDDALRVAEHVREEVAALKVPMPEGGAWNGSVSVGVAAKQPGMQSMEDLVKAADEGLYKAKRKGRNRVECGGG